MSGNQKNTLTIQFPEPVDGITPALGTKVLDANGNSLSVKSITLSATASEPIWRADIELTQPLLNGQLVVNAPSPAPVSIGEYWPGQGGIYAGIMRDGDHQWHLILADQSTIKTTWGEYPSEIPGEFSRRDGLANTRLILAAEPQNTAALQCTQLIIDSHQDYYWPAQCENNLLFANLPEHLEKCWHWSSTQYSSDTAWGQGFEYGYQTIRIKGSKLAVRAVRRLPIE